MTADPFNAWYAKLGECLRPPTVTRQQVQRLSAEVGLKPPARVLDAGCGYGRMAGVLDRAGWTVVGVDASARMVELAGELNPGPTYLNSSIEDFDGGGFQLALSLNTSLGYRSSLEDAEALRSIIRSLDRGGSIVIEHLHLAAVVRHASPSGSARFQNRVDAGEIVELSQIDPITGRLGTTRIVNGSLDAEFEVQLYSPGQWLDLLSSVGFIDIRFTTWSASPLDLDTPEILVVARKGTL